MFNQDRMPGKETAEPVVIGLPPTGFLRLPQIIGDRKRGIPALIPICKSQWWVGIRDGRYPAPVRIGPQAVAWRVGDIKALIQQLDAAPIPNRGAELTKRRHQARTERKDAA